MKYESIAIMVKIAALEFDKLSNQTLAPYDLTNSQYKILKYILRQPAMSVRQIDLEEYFSMTNPTVTGLLQNMERKGLIRRVPNPEDKRSKVICLTEKILSMEPELSALGESMEASFTSGLDDTEKAQMKALLRKLLGQ